MRMSLSGKRIYCGHCILGFIDLTVAYDWVWLNLHRMSEGPLKQVSSARFKKHGYIHVTNGLHKTTLFGKEECSG